MRKKSMQILGVTLAVGLMVLAAAEPLGAATLHYAPVVSSAGDRIAYVKRHYRYWASVGSIIPFLGGKPDRVHVLSDRIQVCVKDLKTGRVTVVGDWKPETVKENGPIHIAPVLNWELEDLRYVISLRTDTDPGVGIFRRPYAYLTNIDDWSGLKPGPTAAGTVRVRLDNAALGRFPEDNAVVVESTWDAQTALPMTRRKLEQSIASQLGAAGDPAQRDRLGNLLKFVDAQATDRLPEKLVALFLAQSDRASGTYPDLAPVVVQLGEAAIAPLVTPYDRLAPATRQAVLAIFGKIGSATPLTLVRREIRADDPDLQSAAVVALGRIKGDRAGEELARLLGDARLSSPVRVAVLRQLIETPDADWPAQVLDTALENPAVFEQLPDIVPDPGRFPERLIWLRLPKIYKYLKSASPRAVRTAQHLIARIRFWNHLSALQPVVEDLLKARYDYGRTTDAAGNLIDTGRQPADDRVVWDRGLAADMLDHIEKNLDDPVLWLPRDIRNVDNLLTLLYVENLLSLRKGQKIINRPPVMALIEISLRDAAGSLQAAGRRFVEVDRPVSLQSEPVAAGFPAPTGTGRLSIDKKNWRLTFHPLVVDIEGRTTTVPVSIPFGGACEIQLAAETPETPPGCTLTLRHVEAPDAR